MIVFSGPWLPSLHSLSGSTWSPVIWFVCVCLSAVPPPTSPTPRPIPTLPPEQKVVATVISKTASTILIICVTICLIIFLALRIFTPDRIIQMNMEIALVLAHSMLMFPTSFIEMPVSLLPVLPLPLSPFPSSFYISISSLSSLPVNLSAISSSSFLSLLPTSLSSPLPSH